MQKMKMVFILLALGFATLTFYPVSAQANVIEFLFPSLRKKEPDVSQTLQAPFAAPPEDARPVAEAQRGLPENAVPLDQPHRADAAISEWLVTAASEAMMFTQDDYKQDMAQTTRNFDAAGRKEYEAFLLEKSILQVLESKKFYIRCFVQELPLLLNEGAVQERYRWLFEVPMMLSYMDRGMTDYKKADPVSQRVILTIQIGRSPDAQNAGGLVIERWSGKLENIDKK